MRARASQRRASAAGFTLIELLVAIAVLSAVSVLIYGAFSSMRLSKQGLERIEERYREGRLALSRMSRELSSAYLSLNVPPVGYVPQAQKTAFVGARSSPGDRLDFNAFAFRRIDRNSRESDQCEISYFARGRSDGSAGADLVRRVSSYPDLYPQKGGRVEVLATDIDLFSLKYLDPTTGMWVDSWDSTQTTGQPNRLPLQVWITLVLNGGSRSGSGRGRAPLRFTTKVDLPIQQPLNFMGMN